MADLINELFSVRNLTKPLSPEERREHLLKEAKEVDNAVKHSLDEFVGYHIQMKRLMVLRSHITSEVDTDEQRFTWNLRATDPISRCFENASLRGTVSLILGQSVYQGDIKAPRYFIVEHLGAPKTLSLKEELYVAQSLIEKTGLPVVHRSSETYRKRDTVSTFKEMGLVPFTFPKRHRGRVTHTFYFNFPKPWWKFLTKWS